jgi:hypothetical protein
MGSGGIAPLFLTWALDGGERSASCPCPFTPWGNVAELINCIKANYFCFHLWQVESNDEYGYRYLRS